MEHTNHSTPTPTKGLPKHSVQVYNDNNKNNKTINSNKARRCKNPGGVRTAASRSKQRKKTPTSCLCSACRRSNKAQTKDRHTAKYIMYNGRNICARHTYRQHVRSPWLVNFLQHFLSAILFSEFKSIEKLYYKSPVTTIKGCWLNSLEKTRSFIFNFPYSRAARISKVSSQHAAWYVGARNISRIMNSDGNNYNEDIAYGQPTCKTIFKIFSIQ